MGFEPQKLFIGLVDFFSILMPGALLAYRVKDWAALMLGHAEGFPLEGGEQLAVFLFASYLLGHFVFLIGSFLDNAFYDALRKTTTWGQIGRLAKSKKLHPSLLRSLSQLDFLFGKNPDAAVMKAQHIKSRALEPLSAAEAINTYQWCKARLAKELPEGLLSVQRFEADSKFFRSFFVVLLVLAFTFLHNRHWYLILTCLVLLVPAFLRYLDQRFKGTQQAFWLVITLESLGALPRKSDPLDRRTDKLTHAGGLVTRLQNGVEEYLLVQASGNREDWVLPKGHIEPGEDPRETAVREVLEETGCWARVTKREIDLPMDYKSVVRIYRMEWLEDKPDGANEDRRHEWKPHREAFALATFTDTKNLIGDPDGQQEGRISKRSTAVGV